MKKSVLFVMIILAFGLLSLGAAERTLTGTYYINPAGGTNTYTSFTAAINALNSEGVGTGGVTFNVAAGTTYTENCPPITVTGTASDNIIFQKSGEGPNPMIHAGVGTGASDAIVTLSGTDYLVWDGIDLAESIGNTTTITQAEWGMYVINASATNGAQHNILRNFKVTLNRTNTDTKGIHQFENITPTNSTGANSYNEYNNVTVENTYNGIYLKGVSPTYLDLNNIVHHCTIGSENADDIGCGTINVNGLYLYYQTDFSIYNNEVRNLTSLASVYGIFIYYCAGNTNNTVYNNKIYNIKIIDTSLTYWAIGLYANALSTGRNEFKLFNNTICGITHAYAGPASTSYNAYGIYFGGGNTTTTWNVDFNSIRIDGSAYFSSACIFWYSNNTINKMRNNILANFAGGNASLYHACYRTRLDTNIGNTGSISDHNVLYVDQPLGGYLVIANTTNYTALTGTGSWNAVSGLDSNSNTDNPRFISASDLHINDSISTSVESGGNYFSGTLSWVTQDMDSAARYGQTGYGGTGSAPDIGADEGDFLPEALCIAPITQPGSLLTTPFSTQISGSFTAATAPGAERYLIIRSSAPHDTLPVDGATYTQGNTLGNGTVVQASSNLTFSTSGLTASSLYYFTVYAYNFSGSGTSPMYNVTSPLTGTRQTLSGAPLAPTSLTATAASTSQVNLAATANASGDSVMIAWALSPGTFGTPVSSAYTVGNSIIGGGTVLYVGLASELPNHTGLTENTAYYYKAWSLKSETINPYILYSATGLTANATTLATPLSGFYTINPSGSGSTNFTSFATAVSRLNLCGISAAVTFTVKDDAVFTEEIPPITATGTLGNLVTFQRSNDGSNRPVIKPTVSNAGIQLNYCDYFVFDGIDIMINSGLAVRFGYFLCGSATNGAQHNIIKNCKITLNKANTSSTGILQEFSTGLNSMAGTNSYNIYDNVIVENSAFGINLHGWSSYPDVSTIIRNCTIGSSSADNMGGIVSAYGIKSINQQDIEICNNEIRNITTTNDSHAYGIYMGGCGKTLIYNNKLHDIKTVSTLANCVTYGMYLSGHQLGTDGFNVYNNMIYGISHTYSGAAITAYLVYGIYVYGFGTITNNVDFNSIRIEGPATGSSVCIYWDSYAGTNKMRNNILANYSIGNSTSYHVTVHTICTDNIGTSGSITNRNVMYIDNTLGGYYVRAVDTNYSSLTGTGSWNAVSGQDSLSWTNIPQFISASNLHINLSFNTPVESNASYFDGTITWVSADIDGDIRDINTPDIGADEGLFNNSIVPPPPFQPTNLVFGLPSQTSISGSFAAATGAESYLVVRSLAPHNTSPVSGTTYSPAGTLGNGTVIQISSNLSFNSSGLTACTTYYFTIYSLYYYEGVPVYATTNPLCSQKTTLIQPPDYPAGFTATVYNEIQINLTAASNASNDSIMVIWNSSNAFGTPAIDVPYVTGNSITGGGTVFYTGLASNLPNHTNVNTMNYYYYRIWCWKTDVNNSCRVYSSVYLSDNTSSTMDPLSGIYYINPTEGGRTFTSFTAAINAINTAGIASGVTFNVAAGTTYTENCPAITTTGTSSNPIVFQRNGEGANPIIYAGVGIGTTDAIVTLRGVDYLTWDGIDLYENTANTTTTTQSERGLWVTTSSTTNGSQHNTFENFRIVLNKTNSSTRGIYHYYGTMPTSLEGTNSYNDYYNIIIENTYYGIYMYGSSSSTYVETNNSIRNCTIGGATAGDISGPYGMYIYYQKDITVCYNEVRNIGYGGSVYGIYLNYLKGTTNQTYSNKIHDIAYTGTSTSGNYGLYVSMATSGTNEIKIYNNMIWGQTSGYTGEATTIYAIYGMYFSGTNANNTFNVDFNSIRVEGPSTMSSAAVYFATATPVNKLRNNLLANFTPGNAIPYHICLYSSLTSNIGATGSLSNCNLFYVDQPLGGYLVKAVNSTYTSVSDSQSNSWYLASWQDGSSIVANPMFNSALDLHFQTFQYTPVESFASYFGNTINWVTTDIDGDIRSEVTTWIFPFVDVAPDIGADEGTFISLPPLLPPNSFTAELDSNNQVSFTATENIYHDWIIVAWSTDNVFGDLLWVDPIVGSTIPGGGTILYAGNAGFIPNHTGLISGTTYYYRAYSIRFLEIWAGSEDYLAASVTTPPLYPLAPIITEISRSNNDVVITWDTVTQSTTGQPINVNYYVIYMSDSPTDSFEYLAYTTGGTTEYNDIGGAIQDCRFYRVISFSGNLNELQDFISEYRTYPFRKNP